MWMMIIVVSLLFATCIQPLWSCSHADKINSSPPGQYGRHFADDIFRRIFVNENVFIVIKASLKFVSMGPIDNNPALV